jgi:hypothetical protein
MDDSNINTEMVMKTFYNIIGKVLYTSMYFFCIITQKKQDALCLIIEVIMLLNVYKIYLEIKSFKYMIESINKTVVVFENSPVFDLCQIVLCSIILIVTPSFLIDTLMNIYGHFTGLIIGFLLYLTCAVWIFFSVLIIYSPKKSIKFISEFVLYK